MKILLFNLINNILRKPTKLWGLLFFNLNYTKLTFNLKIFHNIFTDLKLGITYFLIILDINSIIHGSFIFFKLSKYKYKYKNKLKINLYILIHNRFINNNKQKVNKGNLHEIKYNNFVLLLIYIVKK